MSEFSKYFIMLPPFPPFQKLRKPCTAYLAPGDDPCLVMLQKVDKRCCCALLLGGQITNCKAVIIKDVPKNLEDEIFLCPPHTINFDKHNWHKGSAFQLVPA